MVIEFLCRSVIGYLPRAPGRQAVVVARVAAAAPALLGRLALVTLRAPVSPLEVILTAGLHTKTERSILRTSHIQSISSITRRVTQLIHHTY